MPVIDISDSLAINFGMTPHSDPDVRAAYHRNYREKHAEKLRQYQRDYAASGKKAESFKRDYAKHSDAYKARAKAFRLKHADEIRAYRSTPEYRARVNAYKRAIYARAHPKVLRTPRTREQVLAAKRADYQKNRERYRAQGLLYYESHKEQWKQYWANKDYWKRKYNSSMVKARRAGVDIVDANAIKEYYRTVFSRQEIRCAYCNQIFPTSSITVDHKEPFARGGNHEVSNFELCCRSCNSKKHTTPYEEWITRN